MQRLLFFIFLACSLPAWAQENNDSTAALRTISRKLYSISYPAFWGVDSSRIFELDLLIYAPKKDSADDSRANVSVFVIKEIDYDLLKFGQDSESQIKATTTDARILESRLDSSAAQPYFVLKYSGKKGWISLTTTQYYFTKNKMVYIVTFVVRTENEQEHWAAAQQIIRSFKLH